MTDNYWTTGADDDQSGARYEVMTVTHPNGEPVQAGDIIAGQEVTVQFDHEKKTAVLLHTENNTCQVEK